MVLVGEVAAMLSESQQAGMETLQHLYFEENETCAVDSCSPQSDGKRILAETDHIKTTELLNKGVMKYGCSHYQRRCCIRAPCCNEIFDCRHCHNEVKNNINVDWKLRHEMPRCQVSQVICSLCGTEQEVQQVCINCGVCMGKYYCETCKLFDDDKKQGLDLGRKLCIFGFCRSIEMLTDVVEDTILEHCGERALKVRFALQSDATP